MTPKTVITAEMIDPLLTALAERLAPLIIAAMAPPPAPVPDPDETWTANQVCEHLGMKMRTLYDRKQQSTFPRQVNVAGRPQWLASDIRAYKLGTYAR